MLTAYRTGGKVGWSVGAEKHNGGIVVYRLGNSIAVEVTTNWGVVKFVRAYGKYGWGPWRDTRDGRSARRFADRYSIAEFIDVLRGLHDDVSAAVVEICVLQASIEADERERLDKLVAHYMRALRKHGSEIRRMGWKRASRQWLAALAQKSKVEASDTDKARALEYALDEIKFRKLEVYSA